MIKKLYCFRHGQTDWNSLGKIQGCEADNPLNEVGFSQAHSIPKFDLDAIYSSPMIRARQTAEAYNEKLNIPIIIEEGFKEIHFGEWSGLSWVEVENQYGPNMVHQFQSADKENDNFQTPGGDIKIEAVNRFINSMKKIASESDANNIGIFSHGRLLYFIANKMTSIGKSYPLMDNSEHLEFEYNTETKELKLVEDK